MARLLPGLALACAIALLASGLGAFVPLIGGAVLAIVGGIIVRTFWAPPAALGPGVKFAARSVLQFAIIVSGFGLSLAAVAQTGLATLPLTLITVGLTLAVAAILGPRLGLDRSLRLLIGAGTAICGASAIAAVASVIEPDDDDLSLAIATIFCFNITAVLVFPPLGHLLHLSEHAFGIWAGTAINDTSSVVAAGYAYGHDAGVEATIVKLTRALLIVPLVAAIAIVVLRRRPAGTRVVWRAIVPWFILWFLAAAAVNSLGVIPSAWHAPIATIAAYSIATALAAIGLQTDLRRLSQTGLRPLAFGFALWFILAAASLAIQRASG